MAKRRSLPVGMLCRKRGAEMEIQVKAPYPAHPKSPVNRRHKQGLQMWLFSRQIQGYHRPFHGCYTRHPGVGETA